MVVNAPEEFRSEIDLIQNSIRIVNFLPKENKDILFLAFVQSEKQIQKIADEIHELAENDQLIWFAYPKKSSKKFKVEINRDNGWQSLGVQEMEGVRAVSIDKDWSAIRFRKVKYIKTFTRNSKMVLSKEGISRLSKD